MSNPLTLRVLPRFARFHRSWVLNPKHVSAQNFYSGVTLPIETPQAFSVAFAPHQHPSPPSLPAQDPANRGIQISQFNTYKRSTHFHYFPLAKLIRKVHDVCMSYAITDAGEQDMRAELAVVEHLNEEIDQLNSEADKCGTLCPQVKTLLSMAWFFTEEAYRDAHGHCSAHRDGNCQCCQYFASLKPKAESLRGRL